MASDIESDMKNKVRMKSAIKARHTGQSLVLSIKAERKNLGKIQELGT